MTLSENSGKAAEPKLSEKLDREVACKIPTLLREHVYDGVSNTHDVSNKVVSDEANEVASHGRAQTLQANISGLDAYSPKTELVLREQELYSSAQRASSSPKGALTANRTNLDGRTLAK